MGNNAIELYESDDGKVRLNVQLDGETVWLSQPQMISLEPATALIRTIDGGQAK